MFSSLHFIKKLVALGERQHENELKAARIIEGVLSTHNIPFVRRPFVVEIPKIKSAKLFADGKTIPTQGCGMVSGKITSQYAMVSSLISSQITSTVPNISFNPRSRGISRSNHYFAPALAIQRSDIARVARAKKVEGSILVQKKKHSTYDILVGNTDHPKDIVFAHFDSIGCGAIDNASGVAVMLGIILKNKHLLATTLFVFSANEEISYDSPVYWGHGFRDMYQSRPELFRKAKRIVVIDSVGHSPAMYIKDPQTVALAFPLNAGASIDKKVILIAGDFDTLMTVYHSMLDNGSLIKNKWLIDAHQKALRLLLTNS